MFVCLGLVAAVLGHACFLKPGHGVEGWGCQEARGLVVTAPVSFICVPTAAPLSSACASLVCLQDGGAYASLLQCCVSTVNAKDLAGAAAAPPTHSSSRVHVALALLHTLLCAAWGDGEMTVFMCTCLLLVHVHLRGCYGWR
jgi:hypothetical protein